MKVGLNMAMGRLVVQLGQKLQWLAATWGVHNITLSVFDWLRTFTKLLCIYSVH